MALRRQGLSERRKAVGLTQESLAERLGVERSTVVRWEAGDTEPLPSIRPNVARALHVSIDQLAELLTESRNADTRGGLSADTEVATPVPLSEVQSEVRPSRAEFEDLIRSQVAETVEALRRVLRSAGVSPEVLDAMLLVGTSPQVPPVSADIDTASADVGPDTPAPTAVGATGFAGSDVPEPAQNKAPYRPSMAASPLDADQRRQARSRRRTRFAAAGVLALVLAGAAASAPFITSQIGPPAAAGTPAPATPVAAIPAPDPGSDNKDSIGAVHAPPAAIPNKPVDGLATPVAAVAPAPHTTRATGNRRTSRSKPPAAMTRPMRRSPPLSAEAYALWSRMVALSDK